MNLAEKLRRLRKAEGMRRGLWRTLTQHEVTHAMRQEIGVSLSQAYLSQLESGARIHLTNTTREALARFYHVHPGYLVNDPPGVVDASDAYLTATFIDALGGMGAGATLPDTALLRATLAQLAATPDPMRALRLLDWLLRLPADELAELERRAQTSAAESAPSVATATAQPQPDRADRE